MGFKLEQISSCVLDYLYDLQDNRNHFSHTSTPTKEQAEEELKKVQPLFEKVLKELRFLENVNIVRFESFTTKCRFETFKGHYLNKEYDEINLAPIQLGIVMTNPGEVIFARWDEEIFSLSPFLHFLNDMTGHETYLCFYKGKKDCKYWYEPVKKREELVFDPLHGRFDSEHTEIIRLLVPQ
jgi:hypothetical protein